jgi:hypothetical protein
VESLKYIHHSNNVLFQVNAASMPMHTETLPHGCTVTEDASNVFLVTIPKNVFPEDERFHAREIIRNTLYPACHDGRQPSYFRQNGNYCELYLGSMKKVHALMEQLTLYLKP